MRFALADVSRDDVLTFKFWRQVREGSGTKDSFKVLVTEQWQGGRIDGARYLFEISQGQSSATFSVSVNVDSLGIVNVTTTVALLGNPPTSGTIVIDGVDSTLTLTFTGAGGVTVALDEDGDGETDCSQDLTLDTIDQFNPAACPVI